MSTTETERPQAIYALGHTPEEYERLRMQARVWDSATGRLLDQVGLAPGASCLDAGCGPGETMRAMAERVGPAGRVLGIDADSALGAMTLAMLHGAGHRHCSFRAQDLTAAGPIPGAPFDLDRPRRHPLSRPPGAVAAADRRLEAQGAGMTTDGPVDHIALHCAAGHHFRMAADRLPARQPQSQATQRPAA
jgi:SAM-dependent methyltransferase